MKRSTALKRFASILFAILLISSFVLLTACGSRAINPSEDENPPTDVTDPEEEEILEIIRNGMFNQYADKSTTSFPATPKNWGHAADSYAGQSASRAGSDVLHGIISVDEDIYNGDKSKFKTSSMDEPLPDNPGYPIARNADDDNFNDKILMIQNTKPTAGKYRTSSSISIPMNSYALISVYVKTVLVKEDGSFFNELDELKLGQGATISLTGGTDKPVILYGIQTAGEWKEYQFIIEGSSVSAKNLTLELGLGRGSPINSTGYTEGFAFFAEAKAEYITKKNFNSKKSTANESLQYDGTTFGSLLIEDPDVANTLISYTFKGNNLPSQPNIADNAFAFESGAGSFNYGKISNTNDAPEALKKDLENFPFTDANIAYMQKTTNDNYSMGLVNQELLTDKVKEGEYYRISFWVKTSNFDRGGLNIYLINTSYPGGGIIASANYKNISNINTSTYKLTQEEKDKATNANLWDDWRQYSFYVDGGIFERGNTEKNLALEIWLGSVNLNYRVDNDGDIIDAGRDFYGFNAINYVQKDSYAMITNMEVESLSRTIYNSASSGENSITGFNLSNRYSSSSGSINNGSFNNVRPSDTEITDMPMLPEGFTGMYKYGASQGSVISGVVNTNLWNGYSFINLFNPSFNALEIFKTLVSEDFSSLLMIYNQEATSYGYASDYMSLSGNTYTEISVMVKTLDAATANIYLVDREGNRLDNYILNKYGERVFGNGAGGLRDELVYNPFYDEKYDLADENGKYGPEEGYDANSPENKLLRKGTKLVAASTIPVQNPFYDENFRKVEEDKPLTWKKELTKYFLYDRAYWEEFSIPNENENLYTFIDINYNAKAGFSSAGATVNDFNGFTKFTFFIKTGHSSKDVRLELWNGDKYGNGDSIGAVFFDNATRRTITKEAFYEYVLTETHTVDNEQILNAMFFDMSGYDNIPDPSLSQSDVDGDDSTNDNDSTSEFPWSTLLVILPTSIILIALVLVAARKLKKNKKEAEETVTEAPTYARQKTSKKSSDNEKNNKKFE